MNKELALRLVPQHSVESIWIKVLPYVLNGEKCWDKFYRPEELKLNLLSGRQQLWVMLEDMSVIGCVLTQLDVYPTNKAMRILFLGGDGFKRGMIDHMRELEKWAKSKGATVVDFLGRDEWWPLIKRLGYETPGRVYRKEI